MKFEDLKMGAPYLVVGTLVNIFGNERMDPSNQSVMLKLPDGQALNTNIGNILPGSKEEADALRIEAANKQAAQAKAQAVVADDRSDAQVELRRERDEWRAKAEQLEQHVRKIAQDLDAAEAKLKSAGATEPAQPEPERKPNRGRRG